MENNTIYIIEEENHGIIGVADSKKAVFSFLVSSKWITADTLFDDSWDYDCTLADICVEEDVTKENFLNWAIFKLENTSFWEDLGFYIYAQRLYTEKTI